ncbi:O-methyltransferase [[Actinomadura] parvosata subsp. kistnae]|uniref:O-methyltransferase domain-containing protein n=1 Tax=[Actinomadura] parvosata subsp. kistnae TaxID=1909395 RepID=A0A1U9ZYH7_9ACTN|nr:methyltransferase [Nonomuraea sp. ATCC 55076]AQZ63016.1 hypothetical protein BKM31_17500 [Nonomuraea sp. ATCC 55076]SPL99961.1 O-methyltransferase [Actinomadura parvosata subsp. kistnae]
MTATPDEQPAQQDSTVSDATLSARLPQRSRPATLPAWSLARERIAPYDLVQFMMDGVADFCALYAAVELGIFELLAHEELTSDELADACEADPATMRRLMRWLHGRDFVGTYGGRRYQLTELGQVLTAGAERSQRHAVLVTGSSYWMDAIRDLTGTICRGHPAPPSGLSPYDHLARHPDLSRDFDLFMTARCAALGRDLAASSDFEHVRTVADLGGGLGGVLSEILTAHPQVRGILADRQDVLDRARDRLADEGLADRVQLTPGDFFDRVPGGADIYLLSSVGHNYSDAQVVELLIAIRETIEAGHNPTTAEVWIAEGMLPRLPGAASRWHSTDIRMLALFPGDGVRQSDDYCRLIRQAGLHVRKVSPLSCGQTLMTARLAEQ